MLQSYVPKNKKNTNLVSIVKEKILPTDVNHEQSNFKNYSHEQSNQDHLIHYFHS